MSRIVSYERLPLRPSEIARYARCRYEDVTREIDEAAAEVCEAASYRVCYDVFPVSYGASLLDLGFACTQSQDLRKCLRTCGGVIVFAATAGFGVDRLIQKYNRLSPAKAVLLHAAGSEAVEALCDRFCADMEQEYGPLRPRFSPGYGDLPLALQKDIFSALSCTKNIGVSLSDSLRMTPSKSVTAIAGIINTEPFTHESN